MKWRLSGKNDFYSPGKFPGHLQCSQPGNIAVEKWQLKEAAPRDPEVTREDGPKEVANRNKDEKTADVRNRGRKKQGT